MMPNHDDVIKWEHFPHYWTFVRGIHRSPVNSLHKGQWRGTLMFSLICVWINGWVNNHEVGDLRRSRAHYDVTVMIWPQRRQPSVLPVTTARHHDIAITSGGGRRQIWYLHNSQFHCSLFTFLAWGLVFASSNGSYRQTLQICQILNINKSLKLCLLSMASMLNQWPSAVWPRYNAIEGIVTEPLLPVLFQNVTA